MATYQLKANITISLTTIVEADSKEDALDQALDRSLIHLCHQCAGGHPEEEWVTSGELDGSPTGIEVDE